MIIPRPDGDEPYRIPLSSLRGTISCVPVRRPTQEEFRDETLKRFELTYATPEWEHWDPMRAQVEESLLRSGEYTDSTGDLLFPADPDNNVDPGILTVTMEDRFSDWNRTVASMGSIYLPGTLYNALRDCVVRTVSADRRSKHSYITPEVLARNWGISLETAKRTLDATTQLGVRTRPQDLVRRFKTNDRMLRYTRLNVEMYTRR